MTLTVQQLSCIREVVAHRFGISRTAEALHSTQPGISKMVRGVEKELGVEIFVRRGNRLVGLTEAGAEIHALAGRVLQDLRAMQTVRSTVSTPQTQGALRIGTTHIHARYRLLGVTEQFLRAYPMVKLEYSVGTPMEIVDQIRDGSIDIGLSTLPEVTPPGIVSLKAYDIERCLAVPPGHPLLQSDEITLEMLAAYPWISHDDRFTSGSVVRRVFQTHGIQPRVVMRAMDVNVMKAYVARGIGIAVVQKMALEDVHDGSLRAIEVGHLFPSSAAMISLRSDHLLKMYAFEFIHMLLPEWTPQALQQKLSAPTPDS